MTSAVGTTRAVVADRGRDWLGLFGQALSSGDIDAVVAMFAPECYWRDLVAHLEHHHRRGARRGR